MYDRLGLEDETIEILGLKLPALTIPVSPGRNLAIIMEIAAMNNRQKRMGYNTAEEFNKHLMNQMNIQE
jgi:HPr kinase/phosphorylase